MTSRLKGSLLLLVGLVSGVALTGIVSSVIAHGGDINLIHACVKNNKGSIRIVGANEACGHDETALDWNIQGPPGPVGSPGPAGSGGLLSNLCTACNFSKEYIGDKFTGQDLTGYNLSGSDFTETNLEGTNFTNAIVNGAYFYKSVLLNATFEGAEVRRANFGGSANMTNINFTGADLTEADINTVIFQGANLTNANLTRTKIDTLSANQVNFLNANMDHTWFRDMSLVGALNLNTASNVETIFWDNVICPDGTHSTTNGNTCLGHF
jgi:hypothetical protein